MKKILHEISGFFTILSFIIKDRSETISPFVTGHSPDAPAKPVSTVKKFAPDQNDATFKEASIN